MKLSAPPARWAFAALFLFLTLPCLTYLGIMLKAFHWLLAADMALRAVPLCVAVLLDRLFSDGGELTPAFLPVWVSLTGMLLWPLLALAVRPRIWGSRTWRHSIAAYAGVAVVATAAASGWVFTHLGVFF